jgi:OOP family OmpA-OmpF porin
LTNDNFTVGLNYYFGTAPAAAPIVAAAVVAPVVAAEPVVQKALPVAPVVQKEEVKQPVYKTIFSDKPVTIEGASFDTGSAKLKPAANVKLNQVVDFAAKNKDANLTVTGYTDNRGSAKLNDKLSAKRAGSVKAYLVKKGVSADRITATGKGMANPVADNKTKAGRATNRRVEINSVVKEEKKVQVK